MTPSGFFILVAIWGGVTVLNWLGLIYGWGLKPENWFWIIGTTVGAYLLLGITEIIRALAKQFRRDADNISEFVRRG